MKNKFDLHQASANIARDMAETIERRHREQEPLGGCLVMLLILLSGYFFCWSIARCCIDHDTHIRKYWLGEIESFPAKY